LRWRRYCNTPAIKITTMISSTHGTVHTVVEAVTGVSATLFPVAMVRGVPVTEAWERT
jgi:hypothetical protein